MPVWGISAHALTCIPDLLIFSINWLFVWVALATMPSFVISEISALPSLLPFVAHMRLTLFAHTDILLSPDFCSAGRSLHVSVVLSVTES